MKRLAKTNRWSEIGTGGFRNTKDVQGIELLPRQVPFQAHAKSMAVGWPQSFVHQDCPKAISCCCLLKNMFHFQ